VSLERGDGFGMSMVLSGDMLFLYAEVYLNAVKRLASMENREYREGDGIYLRCHYFFSFAITWSWD